MSAARLKLLFVCSRNRRRSLTAEHLFRSEPRWDVRSAGTQPGARVPLTPGLVRWADVIFVMEKSHRRRLEERFSDVLDGRRVVTLLIPDDYDYMQPELIDELEAKVRHALEDEGDSPRPTLD